MADDHTTTSPGAAAVYGRDTAVRPRIVVSPTRSLAARITLLSWIIVVAPLTIFVVALIPAQRRALLESLTSKAADIATSVGQATATPLLLNDYAAVVEHCLSVVQERPTIRYVVVTRREGVSLIHTADEWRQATLGGMWTPTPGFESAQGRIVASDLVAGTVFHYTHKLTYSGVDCGWIHIGLSLESFEADLAASYRRCKPPRPNCWRRGTMPTTSSGR